MGTLWKLTMVMGMFDPTGQWVHCESYMVRGMFDPTGQWAHWKLAMVRGMFDPTGQWVHCGSYHGQGHV